MLYAIVLQAKAPFKKGQNVSLFAYKSGQAAFDTNLLLEKPDIVFTGTVTQAYDMPFVKFGGTGRWFLPFWNRTNWVLAVLQEAKQ